jgi:hypothetical protein
VAKSLTPTLLVAQRSSSSRPYVRARLQDFQGDRPRLRPVLHFSGGGSDGNHTVLVTSAGTLLRARILAGPALRVDRIVNPTPSSTFGNDVEVETDVGVGQGIALTQTTDGTIWLFYLDNDTITVRYRTSSDDGASWSAAATSVVGGGALFNLVAAAGASGTIALAVTFSTNQVYTWRWTGSAWTVPALWPHTPTSVNGLAMAFKTTGRWW